MTKEELIEAMVSDVMEDFDFDKVHDVIVYLDWKWQIDKQYKVPNTWQVIKKAEGLLRQCANHYGKHKFHLTSSCGFTASLDDGILALNFTLEESSSDHLDFIGKEE